MLPEDVAYIATTREDRALRKESPSARNYDYTPVPSMVEFVPGRSSERTESSVNGGDLSTSPTTVEPTIPDLIERAAAISTHNVPSPQTPASSALSILQAPNSPANFDPMAGFGAPSPFEYRTPDHPASPNRPWTPPQAMGPPRAWSTTPASSQSRAGTSVLGPTPPREETPPPTLAPGAMLFDGLWNNQPASRPVRLDTMTTPSPPPVQVPPPASNIPQASTLGQSPSVTTSGAAHARKIGVPRYGYSLSSDSRPASGLWSFQSSPATTQWMAMPVQPPYHGQTASPARAMWQGMPPPPPPPVQSSRPIPVPRSANTLF